MPRRGEIVTTQLAWDLDTLGVDVAPIPGDWACVPARGDIHMVSECGHCEFCGKPTFALIMAELAHLCKGHEVAA